MRLFRFLICCLIVFSSCKKNGSDNSITVPVVTYKFDSSLNDKYILDCSDGVGGIGGFSVTGSNWTHNSYAYVRGEYRLIVRPDVASYNKSCTVRLQILVNSKTKVAKDLTLDSLHNQVAIVYVLP